MLLAAKESAVTKNPRLRLTTRRSSSVRPLGSFHNAMSRDMLISWGIQWLAQVARYFSHAHLYLKGTSWLTSVCPLMIRLSAALTRRSSGAAAAGAEDGAGRAVGASGCSWGTGMAGACGVGVSSHASIRLFSLCSLLAGFAVREAGIAGLEHADLALGLRHGASRQPAVAGHRVELAGAGRGRLLRVGRADRPQVVRRLQAALPREPVGFVELLARGPGHVDVQRLRLVDPLLAAR